MGNSLDTSIFYGFSIMNEYGEMPDWLLDEDERYGDTDEMFAGLLGGETILWGSDDWPTIDAKQDRNKAIVEQSGVRLIVTGHYEYHSYFIAAAGSQHGSCRWWENFVDVELLSRLEHTENWDYHLDNFLRRVGMSTDTERGWIVAPSYG